MSENGNENENEDRKSENYDDWEPSLPSSYEDEEGEEEQLAEDERQYNKNLVKLEKYVQKMAYCPVPVPKANDRLEKLAEPKTTNIMGTYSDSGYMRPRLRKERIKRVTEKYTTITTEQLEKIIQCQKQKQRKKEDLYKRKQEIYYEMLTKLEQQCRTQYLNVLIKKFAKFIAKLATTMQIPTQLVEPYARMQRGLFCNILLAIGIQPTNQAAMFYTTDEAAEYEVCHKLAHALLSLIIKALDAASQKSPNDIQPPDNDFDMDNYIKDRLMCAAEKKILNSARHQQRKIDAAKNSMYELHKKCTELRF